MKKYIILIAALNGLFQVHSSALVNWIVGDPVKGAHQANEKLMELVKDEIGKTYSTRKTTMPYNNPGEFLENCELTKTVTLSDAEKKAITKATYTIMQRGNEIYPQRSAITLGITAIIGGAACYALHEYEKQKEEERRKKKLEEQKQQNLSDNEYSSSKNVYTNNNSDSHITNNGSNTNNTTSYHYHAGSTVNIGNFLDATNFFPNFAAPDKTSSDNTEPKTESTDMYLYISPTAIISLPKSTFKSLQTEFTDSHVIPHCITAAALGVTVGAGIYYGKPTCIWKSVCKSMTKCGLIGLGSTLLTQLSLNVWAHCRNVSFLEKMRTQKNVLPEYICTRTISDSSKSGCSSSYDQATENAQTNTENTPTYTPLYADLLSQAQAVSQEQPHIVFSAYPYSLK